MPSIGRKCHVPLLLVLLLLLLAGCCCTSKSTTQHMQVIGLAERKVQQLTQAIELVFAKRFLQNNFILYVYMDYALQTRQQGYEFEDVTTLLLQAHPTQQRTVSYRRRHRYVADKHYVLILVDSSAAVRYIYEHLEATSSLSLTLIYIADLRAVDDADVVAVLQLLWQRSVVNVGLLIVPHDPHTADILLVSYYPFAADGCQRIRAAIINRYNMRMGVWATSTHFPNKLANFYGCTLTCATWEDVPFLMIPRGRRNGSEPLSYNGIEGLLLNFITYALNVSIRLYMLDEQQVLATFNSSGWIFKELFAGNVDFSIGAFHVFTEQDSDLPYSQTRDYLMSHVVLVTNLQNAYSSLEKFSFPFDLYVWIAIGFAFLLAVTVVCVANQRRQWRRFILGVRCSTPYYNMFVMAVGATLPTTPTPGIVPQRNFARFLFCSWLLATMILRKAYESGIYQLLRDNAHRNPPDTIASVLAQDYLIVTLPQNMRLLATLPEVRNVEFLNTSELEAFPALAASSSTSTISSSNAQRIAILTSYEYVGYFRKTNEQSQRLHLVQEHIFTQQLAMYVRRRSYLVDVLNVLILRARSFGLLEHWKRRYVNALVNEKQGFVWDEHAMDYGDSNDEITAHDLNSSSWMPSTVTVTVHANRKQNVLSMKELAAIFWIVLWVELTAVLVFGMELLWPHLRRTLRAQPHSS